MLLSKCLAIKFSPANLVGWEHCRKSQSATSNTVGPISQADLLPGLFEESKAPANPLLGIPLKCGEASNRCVELAWPWPKVGRGVAGRRLNLHLGWSEESQRLEAAAVLSSSRSPAQGRDGPGRAQWAALRSLQPGGRQRAGGLQLLGPPLRGSGLAAGADAD